MNNCFICGQEVTNKSIKIGSLNFHLECYKAFNRFKRRWVERISSKT